MEKETCFWVYENNKLNIESTMNFNRLIILTLLPFFALLTFTACSDDDGAMVDPDPAPETLVDVAASDDRFSTLVQIVTDLGLADVLAEQELTVFAPTNAAFNEIADAIPTLTNEDLEQIVLYHLVAGTILSGDLAASQDVEMVQGEVSLIRASATGVDINNYATVVEADITASNGVIHAIDQVLLPTDYRVALISPSLVEVAREAGNFETLLELAEISGLTTTLQFLGPYTAFAPVDAAFEGLFAALDAAGITLEPAQIAGVLAYHVIAPQIGEVPSSALEATQAVPTAAEEVIYITSDDRGVIVNGQATVVAPDVDNAVNGIIHVVDRVLLPNLLNPVTGIVQKDYNLTTLLSLVAAREEILSTLSGSGEFTVFAPTNDAFAAALKAFPDLTDDQITEILTYHVIAGATVLSTDLEDGATATTLQGEEITVSITEEGVFINNAEVTGADRIGTNGVVHVINAVILPPSYTE